MAATNSAVTEKVVVDLVAQYFVEKGCLVAGEVPSGSQSIDLVVVDGSDVTAVEAKLNKWRIALEQCRSHEVTADFICIAVALKSIPSSLKSEVSKRGYGLLRVCLEGPSVSWVVRPRKSLVTWGPEKRKLLNLVKECKNGS